MVVFMTVVFNPRHLALANITFVHRPWPREGVVHDGDFVVQDVGIALVEIDALLDNSLVVVMQRYAASLQGAWSLEIACLDLERVKAAVAIGVEPIADRIAREAQHARHAVGDALVEVIEPLAALCLIGEACFKSRPIFRRQRRLLPKARRLGLVPLIANIWEGTPARPLPLAAPVRIFRLVERRRASDRHRQRCGGHDCTDKTAVEQHVGLRMVCGRVAQARRAARWWARYTGCTAV